MHFAYPNVHHDKFGGCVRYTRPSGEGQLDPPYRLANPVTTNFTDVHAAAQLFLGEWWKENRTEIYEIADKEEEHWQGTSLDFAYLMALIWCVRPSVLEALPNIGDVWCTGPIQSDDGRPTLKGFSHQHMFEVKLREFCSQAHKRDRLFFVPSSNMGSPRLRQMCESSGLRVETLDAFRTSLTKALRDGGWLERTIVYIDPHEMPTLVAALFRSPASGLVSRPRHETSRPVFKFLDFFGPEDRDDFFGRDNEIRQLFEHLKAGHFISVIGPSGVGKTSLVLAGLLPSLPSEHFAWTVVRLLDASPSYAVKSALVETFGLDRHYLTPEFSLVDVVCIVKAMLRKTLVIVIDQGEELFHRHKRPVRAQFAQDLGLCIRAADVRIIMPIREDAWGGLPSFEEAIPEVCLHYLSVKPLTPEQSLEAVVRPARALGWTIDADMVKGLLLPQLMEEKEIDPPLLQIVCYALFQNAMRSGKTIIGAEEFEEIGDIRTILGRYLDDSLQQFGSEQREVREVLKALVAGQARSVVSLEQVQARLVMSKIVLPDAGVKDLLTRLILRRLVRSTGREGNSRYELSHDYLAVHVAAWLAERERELTKVMEMIRLAHETYENCGLLLSSEALKMTEPHRKELPLPPDQQTFLDLSTEFWSERAQAERKLQEQKIRDTERRWLTMVVAVWGGFGGAISRMVLSWFMGSAIAIPKIPELLSEVLNPAWHGFWGTVVGGALVCWVFESKLRNPGKVLFKDAIWMTLVGMVWGLAILASVLGGFRENSRTTLAWDLYQWVFPVAGVCWGLGLTIGTYIGSRFQANSGRKSIFHPRFIGGLAGATVLLLASPRLLLWLSPNADPTRVWGEALEDVFSVSAVLFAYYLNPLVVKR